jgi:hypothetical protein
MRRTPMVYQIIVSDLVQVANILHRLSKVSDVAGMQDDIQQLLHNTNDVRIKAQDALDKLLEDEEAA